MEIILKANEADYEGMYELIEPFAKEHLGTGLGMLLPVGKKVIGLIPRPILDKAAAELINKKEALLISKLNEYALNSGIFMTADNIKAEACEGNIKIRVYINSVDYEGIAEYLLPLAAEKAKAYEGENIFIKAFGKMEYIPEGLGKTISEALPQDTKNELAAYFITGYQTQIIKAVNKLLAENNIKVNIAELSVSF